MKYTTISVRQVVQKRQFEPLDIAITAELNDADNLQDCMNELKRQVAFALAEGIRPTTPSKASEKTIPGVTDVYTPADLPKSPKPKATVVTPAAPDDDNF